MHDMLVPLYGLPGLAAALEAVSRHGITVRQASGAGETRRHGLGAGGLSRVCR